jgi:hypothetical protein
MTETVLTGSNALEEAHIVHEQLTADKVRFREVVTPM